MGRLGRIARLSRRRGALAGVLFAAVLALSLWGYVAGIAPAGAERKGGRAAFAVDGVPVRVEFRGERAHGDLFPEGEALPDPLSRAGEAEGERLRDEPAWLAFSYAVGEGKEREVYVAKRPVMKGASWDALARAGAAIGDGRPARVAGSVYSQDATVTLQDGAAYRVRLPGCGQATRADLSEWNLLIGGVHEGDRDFRGSRFGWIDQPYRDEELAVGRGGSLTWCRDAWARGGKGERVTRGYFLASRFHAAVPDARTHRLQWRPVLERKEAEGGPGAPSLEAFAEGARPEVSADGRVRYFGALPHDALFADGAGLAELVGVSEGERLGDGREPWLKFQLDGDALLVAARPLRRSISWEDIAAAGAARGDGSRVRARGEERAQNAEVEDAHGNRYRVRLLRCGGRTMDRSAEWNRLIGGIHEGDGDFAGRPGGVYGWIADPLPDAALGIRAGDGAASWCRETEEIDGERFAVNRGYLTVARYHLTESDFSGSGFGWRPVLEPRSAR